MSIDGPAPAMWLTGLVPGQQIVYAGNRIAVVDEPLASAFHDGDRLVVDPASGAILHVPAAAQAVASAAVGAATAAFHQLARCSDEAISDFFGRFADLLDDDVAFEPIAAANRIDVESAQARGRSTTRLELTLSMRAGMVDGLRGWAASPLRRHATVATIEHPGWSVEASRAPLGVVGFVFEGRPNVFADAAGVLRTGNTVVFRIGSDALGTARAIVAAALRPALVAAGLPAESIVLVDSSSRAAGWALFSDSRLSLAVARGSGAAVAQLGSVARLAGIPVSLHGTGGAWMLVADDADPELLGLAVQHSIDRKVCNTLNVCCIVASRAGELIPVVLDVAARAADARRTTARVHVTAAAAAFVPDSAWSARVSVERAEGAVEEPFVSTLDESQLGVEWEWERSPEFSIHVVSDVDAAVDACNRWSPRFVVSLITADPVLAERCYAAVDAPFVGDGFTRWVDGQYALGTPELGLSNWEHGRILGRGAILSGDGMFTVRYRARITDPTLQR